MAIPVSLADNKVVSTEDEGLTLPYLSTHRKFPGRTLRLRAVSQFREMKLLNFSLRVDTKQSKPTLPIREIKFVRLASLDESQPVPSRSRKPNSLRGKRQTPLPFAKNHVFHNHILRRKIDRNASVADEETPGNVTYDPNMSSEDPGPAPSSPTTFPARSRLTPLLARKYFHSKHIIKL